MNDLIAVLYCLYAQSGDLPLDILLLGSLHVAAQSDSLSLFTSEQFGEGGSAPVVAGIQKAYNQRLEKNQFASLSACDSVYLLRGPNIYTSTIATICS